MAKQDEPQDTRGLTQRELLLELRSDVKSLAREGDRERRRLAAEIQERPTRGEMLKLFAVGLTSAGMLGGAIMALLPHP